jgi:hypothetical protein
VYAYILISVELVNCTVLYILSGSVLSDYDLIANADQCNQLHDIGKQSCTLYLLINFDYVLEAISHSVFEWQALLILSLMRSLSVNVSE